MTGRWRCVLALDVSTSRQSAFLRWTLHDLRFLICDDSDCSGLYRVLGELWLIIARRFGFRKDTPKRIKKVAGLVKDGSFLISTADLS